MRASLKGFVGGFLLLSGAPSAAYQIGDDCGPPAGNSGASERSDQNASDAVRATAIASFVSRGATLLRQSLSSDSFEVVEAGEFLFPGDVICVAAGDQAYVRTADENIAIHEVGGSYVIVGQSGAAETPEAEEYLDTLSWPTRREAASMERAIALNRRSAAVNRRRPSRARMRTGVSRGMSVGSTPRQLYLDQNIRFTGEQSQVIAEGNANLLVGWCGDGLEFVLRDGEQPVGRGTAFVPITMPADQFTRVSIQNENTGELIQQFEVIWIESVQLPRPEWISGTSDTAVWALWLLNHPSGRYALQANAMLWSQIDNSLLAQHALMQESKCGRMYRLSLPDR